MIAGYDDDTVLVGNNDVVRRDLDAVTVHRHIHTTETIVTDRGGGHGSGRVDGEADLLELRQVANAAVDDCTSEAAGEHCGAHEPAHTGDVGTILNLHDVDRPRAAGINGF